MRYVYLNDAFVKEDDAKVSVFDSAITVGDMVTEVARTFSHSFFHLEDHVQRFIEGIKQLKFPLFISEETIINKTHELFNMNKNSEEMDVEWQVVYIYTKGLNTHFNLFPNNSNNTFAILCFPLKNRLGRMAKKYKNGSTILVSEQRAIPHRLLPPQIKSRGRLHLKLAKIQVSERNPDADALLLNENGYITELSGSNLFLVKNGSLYTAPKSLVVPGITRQFIIDISKDIGITVFEQNIHVDQISTYDEAFITSTIIGIIHVRSIENHFFGDGNCGPITKRIRDHFIDLTGCNFVEQAIRYADITNMLAE